MEIKCTLQSCTAAYSLCVTVMPLITQTDGKSIENQPTGTPLDNSQKCLNYRTKTKKNMRISGI